MPTQAAAAVAPPPSAASGSASQQRVEWAPDYSQFIDRVMFPNAVWRAPEAPSVENSWNQYDRGGFYNADDPYTVLGNWTEYGGEGAGMSNALNYGRLQEYGLWDLSSPDSPTWDYLNSNLRGTMYEGDVLSDPTVLFHALSRQNPHITGPNRDSTSTPESVASYERAMREMLAGMDPDFVDQFAPAAAQAYKQQADQIDDSTTFRDVAQGFGEILSIPPLQAALAAFTGGASLAHGGTALGTGVLVGAQSGAINAAANRDNILTGALRGGVTGGLSAGAGGELAERFGGGPIGSTGAGAAVGAGRAALTGGDVFRGAVEGGVDGFLRDDGSDFRRPGMIQPVQVADASGDFSSLFTGPNSSQVPGTGQDAFNFSSPQSSPVDWNVVDSAFPHLGLLTESFDLDAADAQNRVELEAGDVPAPAPSEPEPSVLQDVQRIARVVRAVGSLFGDSGEDGAPADAPVRAEGQSDEQYIDSLAEYMGVDLSSETLAAAGLTPGTPEYYEYIMAQADAVIAQALEGVDVDAEDLASQFRAKSEQEMLQLRRALYVRGQLDMLVGSGTHTDPFTGIGEEVLAGEGGVNPSVAAHQRGLARSVQDLSGLQGGEALDRVRGMLGREADLFGMQAAQDQRFEQAKLQQQVEDERRKRGMLSF